MRKASCMTHIQQPRLPHAGSPGFLLPMSQEWGFSGRGFTIRRSDSLLPPPPLPPGGPRSQKRFLSTAGVPGNSQGQHHGFDLLKGRHNAGPQRKESNASNNGTRILNRSQPTQTNGRDWKPRGAGPHLASLGRCCHPPAA